MNIKKILVYSAVSFGLLGAAASYAGGPDVGACPVCGTPFVPFAYIGASAGWAYSNWQDFIISGDSNGHHADTNGFTYGGKIGYQFLDTFGVEGGGFVLPDSNQSITFPPFNTTISGEVDSWFAYGAATIRAPLFYPFVYVMGKVGGVYRALNHSGDLYNRVGDGNYATVIFGATLEYDFSIPYNLPLAFGVDYYYIPGSQDSFFNGNALNNPNEPIVK